MSQLSFITVQVESHVYVLTRVFVMCPHTFRELFAKCYIWHFHRRRGWYRTSLVRVVGSNSIVSSGLSKSHLRLSSAESSRLE